MTSMEMIEDICNEFSHYNKLKRKDRTMLYKSFRHTLILHKHIFQYDKISNKYSLIPSSEGKRSRRAEEVPQNSSSSEENQILDEDPTQSQDLLKELEEMVNEINGSDTFDKMENRHSEGSLKIEVKKETKLISEPSTNQSFFGRLQRSREDCERTQQ